MARPISIAPALEAISPSANTSSSDPFATATLYSASSPNPAGPAGSTIVTKKEWIIPPRPKPGRKPATDTPPTKRKAQNRAAQRAFRERRAARVNELEDKIKEIEDEDEKTQGNLRTKVAELEHQLEQSRSEILHWQQKAGFLEKEIESLRRDQTASTEAVPLNRRPQYAQTQSAPNFSNLRASRSNRIEERDNDVLMGCGNCTTGSRCACVEQALDFASFDNALHKRSRSPLPQANDSKKPKLASTVDHSALETDFTTQFSVSKPEPSHFSPPSPLDASERCGFCNDGTPCVCVELKSQSQQQEQTQLNDLTSSRLAPVLSRFTPPLSETGSSTASIRPGRASTANTERSIKESQTRGACGNRPGTCDQCRSDPNSTIFCKSLAAMRGTQDQSQSVSTSSGCCGGAGAASGCCKTVATSGGLNGAQDPSSKASEVSLSCADVYTTLSRHPAYEQASDDLGSWLGRLKPILPHGEQGRPAMEVEAASVMGVLKFFDRRFGRDIS